MVPGRPYAIVAALERGRTSWAALLDAIRLEPGADLAAVTANQVHSLRPSGCRYAAAAISQAFPDGAVAAVLR